MGFWKTLLGIQEDSTPDIQFTVKLVQPELSPELKVCPHCSEDLSKRKDPTRCSSFKCKSCSNQIHVDPHQWLYPSPFLTEGQAQYAIFATLIEESVVTYGGPDEYEKMRMRLAKKFGAEPLVGDVLWGLMVKSNASSRLDKWDRKEVRRIMDEFKEFEKEPEKGNSG